MTNTSPPPFELFPIDHWAEHEPFISRPHTHQHYEIFYFLRGHGVHHIDFVDYPIADHAVFLVARHQPHYFSAPVGARNTGWALSFESTFFERLAPPFTPLFGSFTQSPAYSLAGSGDELDAAWFARLKQELVSGQPHALAIGVSLVNILLAYVSRRAPAATAASGALQVRYQQFVEALETHLHTRHTVAEYAALLRLPPKQLNQICRRLRGQSALATIHERLNLEARRQLFRSERAVKEIAYALGFDDPAYFSNFFRRLNGQSPEAFRLAQAQIHKH